MSQTAQALIDALRSKTEPASITPSTLADVLQQIHDEMPTPTAGSVQEFFFGNIQGMTVPGATETELHVGDNVDYNNCGTLLHVNYEDGRPIITGVTDCIVIITGQVNMQPSTSYTSDRVLRWFKFDDEGERYADSVMTTHYTGVTQIFNIPIDYSCRLLPGQTLHLTAFASGSADTVISANSRINIHAYSC